MVREEGNGDEWRARRLRVTSEPATIREGRMTCWCDKAA